jgi:cation diffusion facilitator CzcD-associated flavoprotein CzcO
MAQKPNSQMPTGNRSDILIIGSGYAGLGLAIQLLRSGRQDFLVLERAGDVGGTWRDNHYPGVACDVPSHLYSFSWRAHPEWSRIYSPGPEILDYLRDGAREEGVLPHIRFNTEMLEARWNADRNIWSVKTTNGDYEAAVLVTATGHLSDSFQPPVDGLDSFPGDIFHSAEWNHAASLEGKRIAVIGSGASAIQIIPEMQKIASELVVFQRSAPYVVPREDRVFSEGERRLFRRDPSTMTAMRSEMFWTNEYNFAQRRGIARFLNEAKAFSLGHLEAQVANPELRAKLTPDYEMGCKRILSSSAYYPALGASNAVLEPSALVRVEGTRAYGASGEGYDVDAIVFATGFETVRPPFARRVYDASGISLDEHWDRGMQAYDAIAVHGFPNLFVMNGPNTGLGHNSVVYIIEAQIDYLIAMFAFREKIGNPVVEARREAEDSYMDRLAAMSQGTVWLEGGCKNWYVDPRSNRLTLVWPDFAHSFRDENGTFHPEGYHFGGKPADPALLAEELSLA